MKEQCGVWITKEDFSKIIENIKNHDEEEPLYEGHSIDELYIDSATGSMEGFITIGDIGVNIWIPFGEWFSNFVKFDAFDNLEEFMDNHKDAIDEVITQLHVIKKRINNSSIETKKKEEA